MNNEIQNEVEAPRTEQKENFWQKLWEEIILPSLKSFWEKNSATIIEALKTLGTSLVKAIIEAIKGKKENEQK